MKKLLFAILAMLLLIFPFGGCQWAKELPITTIFTEAGQQQEMPLVTILIDQGVSVETSNFRKFLETVPGNDQEFHVEIDVLPPDIGDGQRDQRMQRVRTEVMAGKGPDIFICDGYNTIITDFREVGGEMGNGSLFGFPTQAMKNRLFLPLDSYMENAQFMEFDQMNPMVMAAGRNEEGQQLLPMTFDYWAAGLHSFSL